MNIDEITAAFLKSPPDFLKEFALTNPGSTNFDVSGKEDPDEQVFVNEYLNYGGKRTPFGRAAPDSFQAETKTLKAKLSFLSLIGGLTDSGRIGGTEADLVDPLVRYGLTGRPQVQLTVDTHSATGFDVYFLPWKSNNTITMKLGQAARYFITAAMTGCTFQVTGLPDAPVVSHANAGGEDAANKLAFMDGQLKKAINDRYGTGPKPSSVARLQTGLWGTSNDAAIAEENYNVDHTNRATAFDGMTEGLGRDALQHGLARDNPNVYRKRDIEIEQTIDGDHTQIVVAVVGWRPDPLSPNWEFYYQVWSNFTVTRKVYRHKGKTFGKGTTRKAIEKTKISDFVILVPGKKLWPNGTGFPNAALPTVATASGGRSVPAIRSKGKAQPRLKSATK